mgnify:FL=1
MSYNLNGETIRVLVDKLPSHVFDYIVEEVPWLLENSADKMEYVYWEPFSDENTIEEIYDNYNIDDEYDCDYWVTAFDDGVLIVE